MNVRRGFTAMYFHPKTSIALVVVLAAIVIGLNKYYTDKNAIPEGESILLPYVNGASHNDTISNDSL